MMPAGHVRATWSGNIRLGTLIVPAKLYPATRSGKPSFMRVHKKDLASVRQVMVCSKDETVLSGDDITYAIEQDGKRVEINDDDIMDARVFTKDIVVRQFADVVAVPSLYYDKPYYLTAAEGGEQSYTVIRNALKAAAKVAVVTYFIYGKQHVGFIEPSGGALTLWQLKFATEVVPLQELPTISLPQPAPDIVDLAVRVIRTYSTDFHISDYRNEQQDILNQAIERKLKGLKPKKEKRLPSSATAENDITHELEKMIKRDGQALL